MERTNQPSTLENVEKYIRNTFFGTLLIGGIVTISSIGDPTSYYQPTPKRYESLEISSRSLPEDSYQSGNINFIYFVDCKKQKDAGYCKGLEDTLSKFK